MQLDFYSMSLFPPAGVRQMLKEVLPEKVENINLSDDELFANTEVFDIRINRDDFLTYINPNRLMIASDTGGGCSLYIDFNPSEYGEKGQIIVSELLGGSGNVEFVLANSFHSLLMAWTNEIEKGSYIADDDELIFSPDGDEDFWITDRIDYFVEKKFLKYFD